MQSVTETDCGARPYRYQHSNERGFAMSLFDLLGGTLGGVVTIVSGLLTGLGGILF